VDKRIPSGDGVDLLFIGSSRFAFVSQYIKYRHGIIIEAIPEEFEYMEANVKNCNAMHKTNFIPLNELITDKAGQSYQFNIILNKKDSHAGSSSIYELQAWKYMLEKTNSIDLTSTTIEKILDTSKWQDRLLDVVLDVQGAELLALKGFGEYINNVKRLVVEASVKEFYKGGCLANELNAFLLNNNFSKVHEDKYFKKNGHGDICYINNE